MSTAKTWYVDFLLTLLDELYIGLLILTAYVVRQVTDPMMAIIKVNV